MLDALVGIWTADGLTALATKSYLDWQFYGRKEKEEIFKTNVANNFSYRANNAVISNSIVSVADSIQEEIRRFGKFSFEIKHLSQLRNHRDAASHPTTTEWRREDMQKFYDAQNHYKDPKGARLWGVRRALVEWRAANGSPPTWPLKVLVQPGTFEIVKTTLALALKDGIRPYPDLELMADLQKYFGKYEEHIRQLDLDLN